MSSLRAMSRGLLCLLSVVLAASASASDYRATLVPISYQSLPIAGEGPLETVSGGDEYIVNKSYEVTLPFPVRFYGVDYTVINMASVGYVTFGPGGSSPGANNYSLALYGQNLPDPVAPNDLVAVWWIETTCNDTNSVANLPLLSQVIGTAPHRQFILQWHCRRYTMFQSVSQFQLVFTEGSEAIEARYGVFITGTDTEVIGATMGIENAAGTDGLHGPGLTGAPCGTNCDRPDFPLGHAVIYQPNERFTMSSLTVDPVAYQGHTFHMQAEIENTLSTDALGFAVDFWLSPTPTLGAGASFLGVLGPFDAPAQSAVLVDFDATVPDDVPPGTYFLVARADPDEVLALDDRAGTILSAGPVTVSIPMPDVAVTSVVAPPWVQVDDAATISWTAKNLGVADSEAMTYEVVLSPTPAIGDGALVLATGVLPPILVGAGQQMSDSFDVPAELEAGKWWIGVVLVPGDADDASAANNRRVVPLQVRHPLAFFQQTLPVAKVGVAYSAQVAATGGDGTYAFRLAAGGVMPPGLQLQADGKVTGTPTALFSGAIPMEVESAGLVLAADVLLDVEALPLEVVVDGYTDGQVGVLKSIGFKGKGGVPPYSFAITAGAVPPGLELEGSTFEGVPTEDGTFRFTVQVTDSAGVTAETEVTLTIKRGGKDFDKTMRRATISVPAVASRMRTTSDGKKVAQIGLASFSSGAHGELYAAIRKAQKDGAKGIVFDLRGNPGGLVSEARLIASAFLKDGTIVTMKGRNVPERKLEATGDPVAAKIPVTVLVDHGSASAAEIARAFVSAPSSTAVAGQRSAMLTTSRARLTRA